MKVTMIGVDAVGRRDESRKGESRREESQMSVFPTVYGNIW